MKEIDITDTVDVSKIFFDSVGNPIGNKGNLKELRVGIRPYNTDILPVIYTDKDKFESKIVTHNYGHGAAGWTLLFGSVIRAINSFEENIISSGLNIDLIKSTKEIAIIGMGCVGLTTALLLHNKGYKNIHLIASEKDFVTSHVAGGSVEIFSQGISFKNKDDRDKIYSMMMDSWMAYLNIINQSNSLSFLGPGVQKINLLAESYHTGYEYLNELGLVPLPQKVKVKCGSKLSPHTLELYEIDSILVNTEVYLKLAYKKLINECNVKSTLKKIEDINSLSQQFIFNCTGLGSKQLNNDSRVYGGCGHGLVLMNQSNENKFDFILTLDKVPGDESKGFIYFMPKQGNYFIGGTNIKNYDGQNENINREQFTSLIRRAQILFHSTGNCKISPKF